MSDEPERIVVKYFGTKGELRKQLAGEIREVAERVRRETLDRAQEECQGVIGNWGGPEREHYTQALGRCWEALDHLKEHWDCEDWPFCEHFRALAAKKGT